MEPNAPNYIKRKADVQLFEALMAREYVFLLDSRQKGKSSLVARTIHKLREKGIRTVKLDLQWLGANVTLEQWYAGLLSEIGSDLELEQELLEYWNSHQAIGPLSRWTGALRDVVLAKITDPLVIFIDEIDFVRALPFPTDEFFAGIRDCYNRRSNGGGFERLTFCIVGVATPGQLIRNPEITPFNIGTQVDLSDFTLDETLPFTVELTTSERDGARLLRRIHYWVNGHPYLTQLLCSQIASNQEIRTERAVDALVQKLFFTPEARQKESNFADIERRVLDPDVPGMSPEERRAQVLDLYGRLLKGKYVKGAAENPVVATLRLSGLGLEERGALRLRNRTYRTVFDESWRRQSLPDAELRRQRGAARLAILRTAMVAGVIVLAISSAAVGILRISEERQKALLKLGLRTDELSQVSSDRKNALTKLERLNADLKRTSNERQMALASLAKSAENLRTTSRKRAQALISLESQSRQLRDRNDELSRVSKERKQALDALESRTAELSAKNYVGMMSSIVSAIDDERYTRIAELVQQSRDHPLRGWEWGHAAMLVNSHEAEYSVPENSVLERQTDRSVHLVTPDSIYDLTPKGLRFIRRLVEPTILPAYRKGGWRAGKNNSTGALVLRDAQTDQLIWSYSAGGRVFDFSPERKRCLIAIRSAAGPVELELHSVGEGKPVITLERAPNSSDPRLARFLTDGTVLSVHWGGLVNRWDAAGRLIASHRIPYFDSPSSSGEKQLLQSRDGSLLCFYDYQYRLLELRRSSDLSVVSTMSGNAIRASSCSFSPDRSKLVVGGYDGTVRVFNSQNGRLLRTFAGHQTMVRAAFFPWDGDNRLISLDADRHLRVWSFDTQLPVEVYAEQERPVMDAWLVNGGKNLVSMDQYGLSDKAILSRNLETGIVSRRTDFTDFNFSESKAFVAREDGRVERLSFDGLKSEQTAQVFENGSMGVWPISEDRLLAISHPPPGEFWPQSYAILDTRSMKTLARFSLDWPRQSTNYPGLSMDRTGSKLLFTNPINTNSPSSPPFGGLAYLVSGITGKLIGKLTVMDQIWGSDLSPDGKIMALAIYDRKTKTTQLKLFEAGTLKQIAVLPPVKTFLNGIAFSPTGITLLGRTMDGPAYLWNVENRRLIGELSPGSAFDRIRFSPDGRRIVTGGPNRTNIVWEGLTGRELFALRYTPLRPFQMGGVRSDSPSFSEDGRKIILACTDGAVRIFNSQPFENQPKAVRK